MDASLTCEPLELGKGDIFHVTNIVTSYVWQIVNCSNINHLAFTSKTDHDTMIVLYDLIKISRLFWI